MLSVALDLTEVNQPVHCKSMNNQEDLTVGIDDDTNNDSHLATDEDVIMISDEQETVLAVDGESTPITDQIYLTNEVSDIAPQASDKNVCTTSQLTSWLKTSTLKNWYVYSHGGIKLKVQLGLAEHPILVYARVRFFSELTFKLSKLPADAPRKITISEAHIPLIAGLLQEETSGPFERIMNVLLPDCVPMFRGAQISFSFEGEDLSLEMVFCRIGEIKFYGLSDAENVKHKSACPVWEVYDKYIQPEMIDLVRMRRALRESAHTQLNLEYRQLLGIGIEQPVIIDIQNEEHMEPSPHNTPKKQRGRLSKEALLSAKSGQKQLSSFFTVIKKSPSVENNGEYFQPFYLKEHSIMAPINYFSDYMMMSEDDTQQDPDDFWDYFRRRCKRSPLAWKGKAQASCMGWDKGSVYFTAKLFQFHENYRSAYFGSLRNVLKPRLVNGRRPFAMEPEVDYEYDSDDDWCEEDEINDGESILSEDEEEDDLEDESSSDMDEEEKEWLVSEGPQDIDEDLDVPIFKRQSYKKGQKRRYVQLQPLMFGPYDSNTFQTVPDIIKCYKARILIPRATPIDPFEGSSLPDIPKPIVESIPKIQFQESHLPELALLANGSSLGVAKLYEVFAQMHGRVSKKQFELRLNQIAEKTKSFTGKAAWFIRPEYTKLLSTTLLCDDALVVEEVNDVAMRE